MAQKNATLRALIEGVIYDLMPKGSVYNVWVDDTTTLAEKLAEVITSLNGKVTPEQMATAIEEALSRFEGGGGDCNVKPFPLTGNANDRIDVFSLEDDTFYYLAENNENVSFAKSSSGVNGGLNLNCEKGVLYYNEWLSGYGILIGGDHVVEYYESGSSREITGKHNVKYLRADGMNAGSDDFEYTPTNPYHPATKKYVDDSVAEAIVIPQGNWNQNDPTADDYIKNRTHWVEGGGNTLEWDGNTDGLPFFTTNEKVYKVSDVAVLPSDLIGGTVTVLGAGEFPITDEMVESTEMLGVPAHIVRVADTTVVFSFCDDLAGEGISLEKGTYFMSMGNAAYTSKLTVVTPAFGEEIVHKIDPKFISIGGYGYDNSEVLFDQTVEFSDMGDDLIGYAGTFPKALENKTYKVTYNGVEYECTPSDPVGAGVPMVLGNASAFGGSDTGEPFMIAAMDENGDGVVELMIMDFSGATSATVKVEVVDIHTIDPKFLPAGFGGGLTIPIHWQTALDSGVEEINTALLEAGYNKSAFLFYTDAHWNHGSQMSPTLLKYLYKNTGMNKTFFGGDIVNNEADDYDTMAYLWDWRNHIKELPNHHSVVGNHDDGNTTNNLFDEKYVYGYLLAAEETPDIVRGDAGLYYYIDSPSEKTRYLFLDTAFQTVLYDAEQAQFVVEALKSTPAGWHIVAVAHIWYNTDYNQNPPTVGSLSYAGTMLLNLFDKYNARGSGNLSVQASSSDSTTTKIAYDFTSCGGKVEFCIGGHTHWDYDGASTGGIPVILCETDSQHVRSGLGYELGTTTEASVNGIVANYDTGEISVIRIGRGSSRVINGTGPVAYTNVLKTAINTDGSLYNGGAGYKDNTRFSTSSKAETTATGWDITGYIPAANGDIFRFKNMQFLDLDGTGGATSRAMIYLFDSSYGYVSCTDGYTPTVLPTAGWNHVLGENGDIVQFTIPASYSGYTYIRIGAKDINETSVITVNEEIV